VRVLSTWMDHFVGRGSPGGLLDRLHESCMTTWITVSRSGRTTARRRPRGRALDRSGDVRSERDPVLLNRWWAVFVDPVLQERDPVWIA